MNRPAREARNHSRLATVLLLLAGMLAAMLILELAARLFVGVPVNEKLPLSRVKADADIGWVMLPNDHHYTYEHPVRLNALGFRGQEVPPRSPREFRILALGDSHVYGQGVGDADLMTTRLEISLNNTGDDCTYRVVNMGVRAYSTNNQLAQLEKFGPQLAPDHIIVFFYINDFEAVNIARRYNRYSGLDWYTFDFSAKPDQDIVHRWEQRQLLRKSAFLMWVHDIYRGWTSGPNLMNRILLGQIDEQAQEKIDTTLAYLDSIRQFAEQQGYGLTLAVIPVSAQLEKAFPGEAYQSVLRRYADAAGVDFLDLLPDLRAYRGSAASAPVIPFDGHYDEQGQAVMAESVFRHLRRLSGCTPGEPQGDELSAS